MGCLGLSLPNLENFYRSDLTRHPVLHQGNGDVWNIFPYPGGNNENPQIKRGQIYFSYEK